MKLIDRLQELHAKNTGLYQDAEQEWNEAIHEAWPKLLAVVKAVEKCMAAVYDSQKLEADEDLIAAMAALEEREG